MVRCSSPLINTSSKWRYFINNRILYGNHDFVELKSIKKFPLFHILLPQTLNALTPALLEHNGPCPPL